MRCPLERLPLYLRTLRGHLDSSLPSSPIAARRHCTTSWDLGGPIVVRWSKSQHIMVHGSGDGGVGQVVDEYVEIHDWLGA